MMCKHTFERVADAIKPAEGHMRGIAGVEVVCVNCGQTRKAFVDGSVAITNDGQGFIDQDE